MLTFLVRHKLDLSRWLLLALLGTLHLAIWFGVQSTWSRPLLFAHLGLFLMWQPLWRGEEKLSTSSALIIVGMSMLAMFWLSWWLLAFWVSGLFALVGGRVFAFQSAWQRFRYLLAMGYLLTVLLVWLTPQLFELTVTSEASRTLMEIALPLILLGTLLIPVESERLRKTEVFDLIYSMLLFLLLTMLVLGSLTFMSMGRVDYFEALLRTLFVMGLVLFVLGWLWSPRLGFSGFQAIFSRYFLNIGTPFELWVKQLASVAQGESTPEVFLKIATGYLAKVPWISGLRWSSDSGAGEYGHETKYGFSWVDHDLQMQIFAQQRLAPAVLMHIHLQCQILAYFYYAKKSEQRLREMMRLQAVHETGARVTHDLKNMLQSMLTMISVIEHNPGQVQTIVMNQLPVVADRISLALSKLKVPKEEQEQRDMVLAKTWWHSLQERHQYRHLEWECDDADGGGELEVPLALFDNVADNLIENARNKRMREPEISIKIQLKLSPMRLTVCDNGSAIPNKVDKQLLRTVVDSEDGLGVGLFQAARWAEQFGYCLQLLENRQGKVCFELVKDNY